MLDSFYLRCCIKVAPLCQNVFWKEKVAQLVLWCRLEGELDFVWGSLWPKWSSFCSQPTCWEISSSSFLSEKHPCLIYEEWPVWCSKPRLTKLWHVPGLWLRLELQWVWSSIVVFMFWIRAQLIHFVSFVFFCFVFVFFFLFFDSTWIK